MPDNKLLMETLINSVEKNSQSVDNLNDKFATFLARDAARTVREENIVKQLVEEKKFREYATPIVAKSKKIQDWLDKMSGTVVAVLVVAVLVVTGIVNMPK